VRNIQVVADKDQNTVLIVATPSEYSIIEQALKKLDVASRQVMIEVTIAEVKLTDTLTFGVDWIFKGAAPSGRGSGGLFQSGGFNPAVPLPTTGAGAVAAGLERCGARVQLSHQQRELPRRRAGGAAPARHVRQHEGHRQPAHRRARQPEGHDQGRQPDPGQPADDRRQRQQCR
jgi:hypothetical protein